jgi:type I restriction enzyme S subunit
MELRSLPADWNTAPLERLCAFITKGTTPTTYGYKWESSGILFLRSECVAEGGLDLSEATFISPKAHASLRRSRILDGDILITITGYVGRVVMLSGVGEANMNQHIARIRVVSDDAYPGYVYYVLSQPRSRTYFTSITTGQAYPQISLRQVRNAEIPLPPKKEQGAIATALSDVDQLLGGLDRLIAKKRDLKQATMQQLLTGQTRLPGFHGEWAVKPLSKICSMKSGEGITSANIDQFSKYPCYGGNGLRGYATRFTHSGSYALVGRQGALCGNVFGVEGQFFASEHAIVVTSFEDTDIRWLTAVLARMNLNQYSESSAQPGLSVSKILKLEIAAPPTRTEQTAIAEVLTDMDEELAALEQRREKTRALKQAIMQELLTGSIRLV